MTKPETRGAAGDPVEALRERAPTIVVCAVIGALAALAVSFTAMEHRPGANAEVTVAQPLTSVLNMGGDFPASTAAMVAAELEDGQRSAAFEAAVAERAGGTDPDQVRQDVTISNPVGTSAITVVARGDDDQQALRLGRAAVVEVADAVDLAASDPLNPMLRATASSPGAEGSGAGSAEVLGLTAKLRADRASLAEVARVTRTPAVTGAGGKRRIALNAVAGLVLGALVGAAIAFLAGRSRRDGDG